MSFREENMSLEITTLRYAIAKWLQKLFPSLYQCDLPPIPSNIFSPKIPISKSRLENLTSCNFACPPSHSRIHTEPTPTKICWLGVGGGLWQGDATVKISKIEDVLVVVIYIWISSLCNWQVLFCFRASLTKLLCHLLAHEHFKCARMLRVHISVWIYRDISAFSNHWSCNCS